MTIEEFEIEHQKELNLNEEKRKKEEIIFLEEKCKELGCKRLARCVDCGKYVPTDENLPFFESRPDKLYDIFYDGCYGWE